MAEELGGFCVAKITIIFVLGEKDGARMGNETRFVWLGLVTCPQISLTGFDGAGTT